MAKVYLARGRIFHEDGDSLSLFRGTAFNSTTAASGNGWVVTGSSAVGTIAIGSLTLVDAESFFPVEGSLYEVTFDISSYTSGTVAPIFGGEVYGIPVSGNGTGYSFLVEADATRAASKLHGLYGYSFTGSVDNLSIKEVSAGADQLFGGVLELGHTLQGVLSSLIVNPDIDDPSKWTLATNWSISGGRLIASGVTVTYVYPDITETIVPGQEYKITVDVPVYPSGNLWLSVGGANFYLTDTQGTGIHTKVVVALNATPPNISGFALTCEIESFSVEKVTLAEAGWDTTSDTTLALQLIATEGATADRVAQVALDASLGQAETVQADYVGALIEGITLGQSETVQQVAEALVTYALQLSQTQAGAIAATTIEAALTLAVKLIAIEGATADRVAQVALDHSLDSAYVPTADWDGTLTLAHKLGQPQDLVSNGSMEAGTTGWTAGADSSLSEELTIVNSGSKSLKITNDLNFSSAYAYQAITTVIGQRYSARCSVYKPTTTSSTHLWVGTTIGGSDLLFLTNFTPDAWIELSGTFVATTTTTYINLEHNFNPSNVAYFDDVSLTPIPLWDEVVWAAQVALDHELDDAEAIQWGANAPLALTTWHRLGQPFSENIDYGLDPEFDDAGVWAIPPSASISAGALHLNATPGINFTNHNSEKGFKAFTTYEVEFEITNFVAGQIYALAAGTAGVTVSGNGVYRERITCPASDQTLLGIVHFGGTTLDVEYLRVRLAEPVAEWDANAEATLPALLEGTQDTNWDANAEVELINGSRLTDHGAELNPDPGFDNPSEWTLSVVNGASDLVEITGSQIFFKDSIPPSIRYAYVANPSFIKAGKIYRCSFELVDVDLRVGTSVWGLTLSIGGTSISINNAQPGTENSVNLKAMERGAYLKAAADGSATNTVLYAYGIAGSNLWCTIDNFTIKEATLDVQWDANAAALLEHQLSITPAAQQIIETTVGMSHVLGATPFAGADLEALLTLAAQQSQAETPSGIFNAAVALAHKLELNADNLPALYAVLTLSTTLSQAQSVDWSANPEVTLGHELDQAIIGSILAEGSLLLSHGLRHTGRRVNLLTYSEAFDNAYWTASSQVAVISGQTDPFGGTGAFIVDDNSGSVVELLQVTSFAVTSGATYTLSVFVKKNASPTVYPAMVFGDGSTWRAAVMNPATGDSKMLSWGSVGSTKVTSHDANWWRFELTATAPSSTLTNVGVYPAYNANYSNTSNVAAQGVQILFGMQFEENASATTYAETPVPVDGIAGWNTSAAATLPVTLEDTEVGNWSALASLSLEMSLLDSEVAQRVTEALVTYALQLDQTQTGTITVSIIEAALTLALQLISTEGATADRVAQVALDHTLDSSYVPTADWDGTLTLDHISSMEDLTATADQNAALELGYILNQSQIASFVTNMNVLLSHGLGEEVTVQSVLGAVVTFAHQLGQDSAPTWVTDAAVELAHELTQIHDVQLSTAAQLSLSYVMAQGQEGGFDISAALDLSTLLDIAQAGGLVLDAETVLEIGGGTGTGGDPYPVYITKLRDAEMVDTVSAEIVTIVSQP